MSNLSVAIVGLPNVGKSTLFNALLKQQIALVANYPFATIEPNVGVVPVPNAKLEKLAKVVNTRVIKPATVEFTDIAGLVKGASQGEGLGNKFLAKIRECNAIIHVLRAFEDSRIIKGGSQNPKEDLAVVRMELQLADLATLEKQKQPKSKVEKNELARWELIKEFRASLEAEQSIESLISQFKNQEKQIFAEKIAQELSLLTAKKELFVVNIAENALQNSSVSELIKVYVGKLAVKPVSIIVMSNKIENELSSLSVADQALYLADLGLEESGLNRLIKATYSVLDLQSFLTAGEIEVKAWTIKRGTTAPKAAGVIHTDFAKKFIKAKVTSYEEFIRYGGWSGVKQAGKLRLEGKNYVMQEDDVVEFMIGS